jgi:uncharacterized membrane protein
MSGARQEAKSDPQSRPHVRGWLRPRPWYHPVGVLRSLVLRPRLYISSTLGACVLYILPTDWPGMVRLTVAWDVGAIAYLAATFRLMHASTPQTVRKRSAVHDESRVVILAVVLLAIASSFGAITALIGDARSAPGHVKGLYLALAAGTIVLSWTLTQIMFTLHYAHDYYRPDPRSAEAMLGLEFAGGDSPDYWDFFYFAVSIGAASQTSDTLIKSKASRRLVTLHAIISFFFNTSVLALAINLAASLI